MVSDPGFPGAQVSLSVALMVMAAAEALQPFLLGCSGPASVDTALWRLISKQAVQGLLFILA